MAGTIPLSMTQQFDIYGKPLAGGQLYIMLAGTVSTPQDAFQDTGLTIKQPYPMTLDAAGRVPQFFLADAASGGNSTVKIRLQDKTGVVQLAADSVLVIGPSGGSGGGGVTVDPTTLIQTGNMILRYGVGVLTGYVRMNGLTIGSSTSSATMPEGARPECLNLFQYLWNTDPSLTVYSGITPNRGTSASADWLANKNIATPDWRGYAVGALDDMGNSASGRLGAYFANATTLGSAGGAPSMQLATGNLPAYTPSGNISGSASVNAANWVASSSTDSTGINPGSTGGAGITCSLAGGGISKIASSGPISATFTGNPQNGASTPFGIISPRKLCTFYLKL